MCKLLNRVISKSWPLVLLFSVDIMKVSVLWMLYFVMVLYFSRATTSLLISDMVFTSRTGRRIMSATSRKLKESSYNPSTDRTSNAHNLNLDDYHPIDPVPSSKACVKPGPIEHGTPLNPYIPKHLPPPSPAHLKKVGQLS